MKIVIVGGGSVGYYLARTLKEHGHEPSLIEPDRKACSRIADDLDIPVFQGDGTTIEALREAGCDKAGALVAVTGKDEANLISCQLGKLEFHLSRTVAKVNNPKNASLMSRLGVDIAVSSTDYLTQMLEREVDTSVLRHVVSLDQGKSSISEVLLPDDFHFSGKKLTEIRLPDQSVIVTVERKGETIIPRGNTRIYAGDKLLIVAKNEALHAVKEKLRLTDQGGTP